MNYVEQTYKTYSPCTIIRKISKHPVISATSEVALAHLLIHRKKEVARVINGREKYTVT